jgi:hypothetical protein
VRLAWISRLRKNDRHLWRSDRSDLVADQLPAGRHLYEDDAALELATGGFAAVLAFQRHPIDRDRYIAAVNPYFHVRIHFNGAELGSARFLVGQALCLGQDRAVGVDEGVIVRPNPLERGGISLRVSPFVKAVRYCSIICRTSCSAVLVSAGAGVCAKPNGVPVRLIKLRRSKGFMGLKVGFCRLFARIGREVTRVLLAGKSACRFILHIRALSFRGVVDCFEFSFENMKGQVGPPTWPSG